MEKYRNIEVSVIDLAESANDLNKVVGIIGGECNGFYNRKSNV